MKTISTIALATSMAVTAVSGSAAPVWKAPKVRHSAAQDNAAGSFAPLLQMPSTIADVSTVAKQKMFAELLTFFPGDPAGDPGIESRPEEIITAIKIIRAIPDDLPLPTLMRDDEGQIGMYWDDRDFYADINIEGESQFSFFSKKRSTKQEFFLDEVYPSELSPAWFNKHFNTYGVLG